MMELTQKLTDEWLEALNEKYAKDDVPPIRRPFLALREWATVNKIAVPLSSAPAKKIFDWFEQNNKPGSHLLTHLFTGTFYFDSCFWRVVIPMGYNKFKINAFKALDDMPEKIKLRLAASQEDLNLFLGLWADCADYAYGLDGIREEKKLNGFCLDMLLSGDKELNATVALLLEDRSNQKAIETARMATEMFLKAFISNKVGLTDKEARKIGHNLELALDRCLDVEDHPELKLVRTELSCFPKIEERYKAAEKSARDLWRAYDLAEFVGATVVRSITGHDMRSHIKYEPVLPHQLKDGPPVEYGMVITLNVDPTEEEIREVKQGVENGTYKMDHEGNINALPSMVERVRKVHPGAVEKGNANILYDPNTRRVLAAIKATPQRGA